MMTPSSSPVRSIVVVVVVRERFLTGADQHLPCCRVVRKSVWWGGFTPGYPSAIAERLLMATTSIEEREDVMLVLIQRRHLPAALPKRQEARCSSTAILVEMNDNSGGSARLRPTWRLN